MRWFLIVDRVLSRLRRKGLETIFEHRETALQIVDLALLAIYDVAQLRVGLLQERDLQFQALDDILIHVVSSNRGESRGESRC